MQKRNMADPQLPILELSEMSDLSVLVLLLP